MKLVAVGVEHDVFRERDMGQMGKLRDLPVVVGCKNVFEETNDVFIWVLGR